MTFRELADAAGLADDLATGRCSFSVHALAFADVAICALALGPFAVAEFPPIRLND